MPADEAIRAEDRELLDRLAGRVVELRMETAALLTLESVRPMSLLAGQAMVFFEPFAQAMFRLPDYRRYAALIERRDMLDLLMESIEARVDIRESARAAARRTPRSTPGES